MAQRYKHILETIGNTPVIRINKLAPEGINLYVKVEAFNPMGSVKDRLALGVIEHAEQSGELSPGQTVIEATSGNTGIGLAMVCAQKDYPLVVTMAENFSVERRKMMRFLGAKVVLTPAHLKGTGMLNKAIELAEKHGWFLAKQFDNEANADIHSRTTAPEILDAFADTKLDYWITGYGTGGTLKGVSRVLREKSPDTKIVVCEPDNSPLLGSGIPQARSDIPLTYHSHPSSRPHVMQGWTPDFIPKLVSDATAADCIDQVLPIHGADAMRLSRELAQQEGIFVGITAGATFAGALRVCESAPEGSNVLCMLPDTGERYLSTPLFADIPSDMTAEEVELSKSTPNYRFDVQAAPPPPFAVDDDRPVEVTAKGSAFVNDVTHDPAHPVVMFGLEWCEFCWSARNLFKQMEVPYRDIELDAVEYQENNWGAEIRAALAETTKSGTVPQIFVGGEFLGGATDVFDAYNEGRLQTMLRDNNVNHDDQQSIDPYSFLPGWLHKR